MGYDTTLHYGSMTYDNSHILNRLDAIYLENQYQIENDLPFKEKQDFEDALKKLEDDDFKVLLGGPVQTILTGTIGLIILLVRRRRIRIYGLTIFDWLAVFLSLFWLREVFNLASSIIYRIVFQEGSYFGGDEKYISEYLKLGSVTLPILLGLLGFLVSIYIIFKIVPGRLRTLFILGGFIGGIIGFLLWFEVLGPVLLPH